MLINLSEIDFNFLSHNGLPHNFLATNNNYLVACY